MPDESNSSWVTFEFRVEPGADVFLAGTFNDWNPAQIRMGDIDGNGLYKASLMLQKGRHEYKFIVNGIWCGDPNCQEWTPNEHGTLNSVVVVR